MFLSCGQISSEGILGKICINNPKKKKEIKACNIKIDFRFNLPDINKIPQFFIFFF